MEGTVVAQRYELDALLGEGGMGSVYRATHRITGKRLALKLVAADQLISDATMTRFRREARAAGVLETPHIVQVFDSGVDEASGRPYIAMELLDGESLKELLQRLGALEPEVALRIVAQAARGLIVAHAAGVVHRDIKPSNIFLARSTDRIVVKVLDFGIAKLDPGLRDVGDAEDLTATGTLLGSPHYISPEQIRAQHQVDHRTDVYSLGVVLYEALCGRRPHENARTMMELMFRTYMEQAPPLAKHAPWVAPAVAAIAARALALGAGERFADMKSMLAALEREVAGVDLSLGMLVAASKAPARAVVAAALGAANSDSLGSDDTEASDSDMRARWATRARPPLDSSTDAVASQSMSERPPLLSARRSLIAMATAGALIAGGVWFMLPRAPTPAAPSETGATTASAPSATASSAESLPAASASASAVASNDTARVAAVAPSGSGVSGAVPPPTAKRAVPPTASAVAQPTAQPLAKPPDAKTLSKDTGEFE